VVGVALKRVEDNPKHQQAYNLLVVLVAARSEDDEVVDTSRTWLNNYLNHPRAHALLSVLMTRFNGAEEWMQKGKEALPNTDMATRGVLRTFWQLLLEPSASRRLCEEGLDYH
jgi:hypothetical protein